ncbi:MAG: glycosyl transferase family 28 [Flavobacterium sp.]|nr:MAG: glycosyl transferase family 28 [Flavobacterium sp.]
MIFITTGTQEPFERLIKAMDEVAPKLSGMPIMAQAFKTGYFVQNFDIIEFMSPTDFEHYFNEAHLIVSHAGMGTIITALQRNKPILVLPRLLKYKEHRSDHQYDTAKKMEELGYINVAYDEKELQNKLVTLLAAEDLNGLHKISQHASEGLINSIKDSLRIKKSFLK